MKAVSLLVAGLSLLLNLTLAVGQTLDAETLKQLSELKALQSKDCLKKGDRKCAIAKALEGLPRNFTENDIKERPAAYEALYRAVNSRSLRLPVKGAVSVSFNNQGTRVGTVSLEVGTANREPLKLWDAKTGQLIRELLPPERSGTVGVTLGAPVFSKDGRLVMHVDPVLQRPVIWDGETGAQVKELPNVPHTGGQMVTPPSMSFAANGAYVMAAGVPGLRVYDVATGKAVWNHKGLMAAAMSPDGRLVATGLQLDPAKGGGEYRTIRFELFEIASNLQLGAMTTKEKTWGVYDVVFNESGSNAALTTSSDALVLVDLNLRELRTIRVPRQGSGGVRFSHDGRYLATSPNDQADMTPMVFDVETGERVTLPLEEQPFLDTVYNMNGERVGYIALASSGDIWRKGVGGPALYAAAVAALN